MPPRFKSSLVLAFILVVLCYLYWRDEKPFDYREHAVDVLKDDFGGSKLPSDEASGTEHFGEVVPTEPSKPLPGELWVPSAPEFEDLPATTGSPALLEEPPAAVVEPPPVSSSLQDAYEEKYNLLGQLVLPS